MLTALDVIPPDVEQRWRPWRAHPELRGGTASGRLVGGTVSRRVATHEPVTMRHRPRQAHLAALLRQECEVLAEQVQVHSTVCVTRCMRACRAAPPSRRTLQMRLPNSYPNNAYGNNVARKVRCDSDDNMFAFYML